MNKNNLKQFVRSVLLEKLEQSPRIHGSLVKKTLSFSGIQRENVCEGTIKDANQYAEDNNLKFTVSEDSYFGGHYNDDMISYEFHPNPEFYGELMELNMSAREQLSRICGTNDQILTEVDVQNVENLIDFICTNESFCEARTNMVFEKIEKSVNARLYDKTQFSKLFEYLVKQACTLYSDDTIKLSESELEYSTNLLVKKFFENREKTTETFDATTKCGKKSFTTGSAFENMQRIKSGHQMFL
tara:strand:- start:246 stop:974 length:729 start_codon:yes stop_codon:yes gene_type:complete